MEVFPDLLQRLAWSVWRGVYGPLGTWFCRLALIGGVCSLLWNNFRESFIPSYRMEAITLDLSSEPRTLFFRTYGRCSFIDEVSRALATFPPFILERFAGHQGDQRLYFQSLCDADFDREYGEITSYRGFFSLSGGIRLRASLARSEVYGISLHEGYHALSDYLVSEDGKVTTFEELVRSSLGAHRETQLELARTAFEGLLRDPTVRMDEGLLVPEREQGLRAAFGRIAFFYGKGVFIPLEQDQAKRDLGHPLIHAALERYFVSDYALWRDVEYPDPRCTTEYFAEAGRAFVMDPCGLQIKDEKLFAAFQRLDNDLRASVSDPATLARNFSSALEAK